MKRSTEPIAPSWELAIAGFQLDQRAKGRAARTISNRRYSVACMARWATARGLEPEAVTKADLKAYLVLAFEARSGLGPRVLYQDLKAFWAWFADEYEAPSPARGIPLPKGSAKAVPVLRPDQLSAILAACKGGDPWASARNSALIWLFLESGVRRAELAALNVEDLDLTARTAVVRRGKGGKARVAVFGDQAAQALHRWLRKSKLKSGPLFTSQRGGRRLSLTGIAFVLQQVGVKAGVPLHPHMFRHAATHYLLEAGAREGDLMETMGWSTRSMLDRYGAELKRERALAAMSGYQVGQVVRGR